MIDFFLFSFDKEKENQVSSPPSIRFSFVKKTRQTLVEILTFLFICEWNTASQELICVYLIFSPRLMFLFLIKKNIILVFCLFEK